jgi:hypothetical protein
MNHISCAKVMREVSGLRFGAWKTQGIHQTHLAAPMPIGLDEEGNDALDLQDLRRAGSNARGIMPMGLLQAFRDAIELGTPASPTLDGQSEHLQLLI